MKTTILTTLVVALAVPPLFAAQTSGSGQEKQKPQGMVDQPPSYPLQEPQEPQPPAKPKPAPPPEKPKPEPSAPPAKPQPKPQEKPQEKEKEKPPKSTEKNTQRQQQKQTSQQSSQAAHPKGQRIPPEKFQASFGREHQFRVHNLQDGRRFRYSGYWFEIVDVWPAGWSYDDECYIEEDADDYYLVDTFHPETRILVIVVEG